MLTVLFYSWSIEPGEFLALCHSDPQRESCRHGESGDSVLAPLHQVGGAASPPNNSLVDSYWWLPEPSEWSHTLIHNKGENEIRF